MNAEPNLPQPRWLLAGAAAALVVTMAAAGVLQPSDSSADWVRFLGRFHPLIVHLPIGVMVLVAAAEAASLKPSIRARLDPVMTPVLVALVAAALGAFLVGLCLARGGGYPDALLLPHFRLATVGVMLLCASLGAWSLARYRSSARWRNGYRALLGSSVAALAVGAHFGGSMTHGEAYLVRFAPQPIAGWFGVTPSKKAAPKATPTKEPEVYANVVAPVLAKYCVNCHGPDKTKGELRLDSHVGLMKGGESGPAIVARAPEKSRLVDALRLPLADVDHMPPEGKPQPSEAQVELISWWILRGANEHERVREVLPPAAVADLLKAADRSGKPNEAANITPKAGHSPGSAAEPEPEPEPEPTAADTPAREAPVAPAAQGLVYDDLIAPLLSARCTKCHGPAKQKGKLRLDSLAALGKGGKGGPAVVPGNPAGSALVQRLKLPLADDEHMPPKNEAQLTAAQIRLLEWWIQQGAEAGTPRERLPESLVSLAPPSPAAPAVSEAHGAPEAGAAPQSGDGATAAAAVDAEAPVVPAPAEVLAELPDQVALFADLILPMLAQECGDCHLGEPLMGDLSVASFDELVAGGVIVPGDPAASEIVRRVSLPATDDDRMPPAGEDPLSALEIAALRFWILEGAEPDAQWSKRELPAEVARAVHSRLQGGQRSPEAAAGSRAPAPGRVAPVERPTARGCGACAVGADTSGDGRAMAALGLLAWLGAFKQRMLGSPRDRSSRAG